MNDLSHASALAGYFVAHGMWSISDGAAVRPTIVYVGSEGCCFHRFSIMQRAEEWLEENPRDAMRAVLVVDGWAELDGVRHDALIARVVVYGPPRRALHVVVPYRPSHDALGFAVHSPRFGAAENIEMEEIEGLSDAFFSGVVSHIAASPIWTEHIDESV